MFTQNLLQMQKNACLITPLNVYVNRVFASFVTGAYKSA